MSNIRTKVFGAALVVAAFGLFITVVRPVFATPARVINFQGRLTDNNGVPVADGNYDMTFKIYDAASGGTLLWTEAHTGASQVTVTDGLFSTTLGSITALIDFTSSPYYLETTIGASVYSRQQMTGIAWSVNAIMLDGRSAGNASSNIPINNGTVNTNLNSDMLDGYHAGNANGNVPVSNGTVNTNLNADLIDGYNTGNGSGNVPLSNGTVNTNLNADMVDGYHYQSLGNFGQWEPHGTYTDCNTNPNYPAGWNYVQGSTNCPNATSSQWYRGSFSLGSNYPLRGAGSYSMELAVPRTNPTTAGLWTRTIENGVIGGWTRIDGSDPNAGAWTLSGSNLYPDSTTYNVGIGNSAPGVKLHITGNMYIDTSGSTSVERNVTIKNSGQAQVNFGAYPGTWTSALMIQNNDNTRNLWLSPLDNASGANARLKAGGTGLDFYVGGTPTTAGTLAASFDTSGNMSLTGELLAAGVRAPTAGYGSGAPVDVGDVAVDYPGNAGWASSWNSNILLSGLNSSSISFHDSGARVDTFRSTGGTFYLGENVGWGAANLYVGNNITLGGQLQADKVCYFTTSFTVNGSTTACAAGYCVNAIVNDTSKYVMAAGDYSQRGVTQFTTARLECCRCSISYP